MLSQADIAAVLIGNAVMDEKHDVALRPDKANWTITVNTPVGTGRAQGGTRFSRRQVDLLPTSAVSIFAEQRAKDLRSALQVAIDKLSQKEEEAK